MDTRRYRVVRAGIAQQRIDRIVFFQPDADARAAIRSVD